MARVPSYQKTTALVARALALTPQELVSCFVPATLHQLGQIVDLRERVIGAARVWDDSRYLSWRYHLGSVERGRGECWVVKRGDAVLAMVGTERILVLHQGHAVDALSVMDIAVRPDFEGFGLGVWMAMQLCEHSDCVLAIGSNNNSRSIVSQVFARLPDRRCYAHLMEFESTFHRRWKQSGAAVVGARAAGWGMKLWRAGLSLTRDRSLHIEPLLRFDDAVERLIAQSRTPHEICVDRSAKFLNWRLFDNPRSAYSVWAARDGAGLAGYIAVRLALSNEGVRTLVIEDFVVRAKGNGNGARVLRTLLFQVFDQARTQACARISVIACHPDNEQVLRSMGFFLRRADLETLSVRCRDPRLGEAINASTPWHLTGANTDRDG